MSKGICQLSPKLFLVLNRNGSLIDLISQDVCVERLSINHLSKTDISYGLNQKEFFSLFFFKNICSFTISVLSKSRGKKKQYSYKNDVLGIKMSFL